MTNPGPSALEEKMDEGHGPLSPKRGDMDAVNVDTSDIIDEEALVRPDYGDRPKIISDVTWDANRTRRSIEIEPLFCESKEDCKARITELFKKLQQDVQRCKLS
jgi:hypothetical protein